MDLNLFKLVVWQLYIWWFVPKDLWYFDKRGKTVIVVPARIMEWIFRDTNNKRDAYLGSQMAQLWTHVVGGDKRYLQFELIFSDDPRYPGESSDRRSGGVVGSLQDFELFRKTFVVMPRKLHIPNPERLQHDGAYLGSLNVPADVANVIVHAKQIYKHGRPAALW